jgi:hypothetical protein
MVLEDGTLVITSAALNTTGIFTCVAENTKGNDQKHFLIEVLGKYPVLIYPIHSTCHNEYVNLKANSQMAVALQ